MRKNDKIKLGIYLILQLSLIIAGVIAFFEQNWAYLALSALTLVIVNLPSIYERRFQVDIPDDFEIVLVIFIYAALFLGELNEFYSKFWWWDKALHSVSGLVFGNMGFLIVSYLNENKKLDLKLTPFFVALFTFGFAVSIGTIWEIFEFFMDKSFCLFMQRGSLDDTMMDLILDTVGALVFSILGYFQQKGKINIISRYLVRFDEDDDML